MRAPVDSLLLIVAALPALFSVLCLFLRSHNARRTASWVKANYPEEWGSLSRLAQRHAWAGIELLIKNGSLSGKEVDVFRVRDEHLEKCSWLGILASAVLVLLIVAVGSALTNAT